MWSIYFYSLFELLTPVFNNAYVCANGLNDTISKSLNCSTRSIAEKKCLQYSHWAETSPQLPTGLENMPMKCGISTENFTVGGRNATEMEFPHMAHLGYGEGENITYGCGASLISNQYLLTVAHCIENNLIVAKLGSTNPEHQTVAKINKIIHHPEWSPPSKYDDVALLQLEKPLREFTDYIRPACIQVQKEINDIGGSVSGWGATTYMGQKSKTLLRVNLPFVNYTECFKRYKRNIFLQRGIDNESMICAGGKDLAVDACKGFGGTPLQIVKEDMDCMYSIVGLTHFGHGCGLVPGVYVRVSHYVSWIESVVWPDE